jgi:hypothetical protein
MKGFGSARMVVYSPLSCGPEREEPAAKAIFHFSRRQAGYRPAHIARRGRHHRDCSGDFVSVRLF